MLTNSPFLRCQKLSSTVPPDLFYWAKVNLQKLLEIEQHFNLVVLNLKNALIKGMLFEWKMFSNKQQDIRKVVKKSIQVLF